MSTTTISPSEPPRGLRLSAILRELHADAHAVGASADVVGVPSSAESDSTPPDDVPQENPGTQSAGAEDAKEPRRRRRPRIRTNITIGEILDRTRQAGFGVIVALMAVISLPLPGLSVPFGAAAAFGALQMIIGLERPWMPQRLRKYAVSMRTLEWIGTKLAKYTGGLERLSRPRFQVLLRGPFWSLCGLGILILAVGLALPLPIPGSNLFFIIPIMVYAIGMLENDGLLIMLGHALTAIEIALAIAFWEIIEKAVMSALHWLGLAAVMLGAA